jgi:hypothetical protein
MKMISAIACYLLVPLLLLTGLVGAGAAENDTLSAPAASSPSIVVPSDGREWFKVRSANEAPPPCTAANGGRGALNADGVLCVCEKSAGWVRVGAGGACWPQQKQ